MYINILIIYIAVHLVSLVVGSIMVRQLNKKTPSAAANWDSGLTVLLVVFPYVLVISSSCMLLGVLAVNTYKAAKRKSKVFSKCDSLSYKFTQFLKGR